MFKRKRNGSTIKKFFPSSPVEVLALQNFFEEMSEKGYLVIGSTNSIFEFEECEPRARRFHIEYFYKASIFDSKPEMKTMEFIDYCEVAGWNHCFSNGKMQCFYTEDLKNADIETDDQLRFQSIMKAELFTQLPLWLLAGLNFFIGINTVSIAFQYFYPFVYLVTSPVRLGTLCFFTLFFLKGLIEFIDYLIFYFRNKKRLFIGEDFELYSVKQVKFRTYWKFAVVIIMLIVIISVSFQQSHTAVVTVSTLIVLIGMLFVQSQFMKSKLANRSTNIVLTVIIAVAASQVLLFVILGNLMVGKAWVVDAKRSSISFYQQDVVPLKLEELGYINEYPYRESSKDMTSTIFAKAASFSDEYISEVDNNLDPESERMCPYYDITIFKSDYRWVTDKYIKLYENDSEENQNVATEYYTLTEQGYRLLATSSHGSAHMILVKDDLIITIRSHEVLSDKNVALLLSTYLTEDWY